MIYTLKRDDMPLLSQWIKNKDQSFRLVFIFGWGAGIRTPEMSESESDALPLGDAPQQHVIL